MNRTTLLSIIIVAYQSRQEIGDCLASLPRGSAGGMVEVIVLDNSPGDGTDGIVRHRFPWVRYIAVGTNVGFGCANNLGFRKSSGAIVLFLNPDTVANAGALEHCMRRLEAEPDIGLISPKLVQADGSIDPACRRSIPTLWDGFCRASGLAAAWPRSAWFAGYNLTHLPPDDTYDVGAINGAFMMARREVLERLAHPAGVSPGQTAEGEAGPERRSLPVVDTCEKGEPIRVTAAGLNSQQHAEGEGRRDQPARGRHPDVTGSPAAAAPSLSDAKAARTQVFDERFFMYGDDLDLCIRVARAGYRIVYDGRVQITHLKGMSVARDYDRMARAIFDANRDVYLKHFNPRNSRLVRWKYVAAFGLWKRVALLRARLRGHRSVKPV